MRPWSQQRPQSDRPASAREGGAMSRRNRAAGARAPAIIARALPSLARRGETVRHLRFGLAGHGAEILVDAAQQVDQDLLFPLVETRQEPAFALKRGNDDLVMGRASFCRQ